METKIIAYCGITCTECDAYKATQTGDQAELERIAAVWNQEYKAGFTAASIMCSGCLATEGPLCSHCFECSVRACASDRGVTSCAACPDYGCDTLEGFLSHASVLRENLEAMRAAHLAATGG